MARTAGLKRWLAPVLYFSVAWSSAAPAPAAQPSDSLPPVPSCIPDCVDLETLLRPEVRAEIGHMAEAIRAEIASAPDSTTRIQALNRQFFSVSGFRPVRAETPASILPASVLRNKQGNCLGLGILYIALARDLGITIRAVAAPNHLFLRYNDGDSHVNLELLERGLQHNDDFYMRQYRIPSTSTQRGVFMRPLSDREVLGHVYLSLGTYYSRIGDFNSSLVLYRAAARNAPAAPTAHLNLGQDFLARNQPKEALHEFTVALHLYPRSITALTGRSKANCRLGNLRKARKDLQTILEENPESEVTAEALANLACPVTPR